MNHRQNRNPNTSDFRLPSSQLIDSARIPGTFELNRTERILAAARNAIYEAERNPPYVVEHNPQVASLQQDDFRSRFNQSDSLQRRSSYEPIPLRPAFNSGLRNEDTSLLFQKQKQSPSFATAPQRQQTGGASPLQQDDFQSRLNQYDSLQMTLPFEPTPLRPGFIPGLQNQDLSLLFHKKKKSLSFATASQQQPPPLQQDDFQSRFNQYDSLQRRSSYELTQLRPALIPGLQNQDMSLLFQKKKPFKRRAKTFPVLLMETITAHYNEDIVSWLPDGRSFVIVNPDLFVDAILKKTFKDCKYASFVRKLNRWGFARITTHCFYHPLFQRKRVDLCAQMLCAVRTSK
jgi:hypothetical protein